VEKTGRETHEGRWSAVGQLQMGKTLQGKSEVGLGIALERTSVPSRAQRSTKPEMRLRSDAATALSARPGTDVAVNETHRACIMKLTTTTTSGAVYNLRLNSVTLVETRLTRGRARNPHE